MIRPNQTSEQAVTLMLGRMSQVGRKQRLSNNTSQADQAEIAGISIKALQKIESSEGGNSSVLFKYLHSLGLLHLLYEALPDPSELTPIEKFAIQTKNLKVRASVKSKRELTSHKHKPNVQPVKWGDET
jgi:transcriptional regulator with XRE-family HTH domain